MLPPLTPTLSRLPSASQRLCCLGPEGKRGEGVKRSPATAHAAGRGHALEPCRSTVKPGCVRVDPRIGAPVLRPSGFAPGRYPRGRRAPRRLPLRPPRPEPRDQLDRQGSSRLPAMCSLPNMVF